MSTRMLIDARHSEETRVTVVKGNRVEEYDYESAARRQLKGNIYLARVTRVEPSLQAAFVEYGGNRHGFLAFSEIHPDYFQIPLEDREAMLEAEREAVELMGSAVFDEEDDEDEVEAEPQRRSRRRRSESRRGRRGGRRGRRGEREEAEADENASDELSAEASDADTASGDTKEPDQPVDLADAPQPGLLDSEPAEYAAAKGVPENEAAAPDATEINDADSGAETADQSSEDGDKTLSEDTGIEDDAAPSEVAEAVEDEPAASLDATETAESDETAGSESVAQDADEGSVDTVADVDDTDTDNADLEEGTETEASTEAEDDAEADAELDTEAEEKARKPRREPTEEEIAAAARRRMLRTMKRKYSIQEVIKKRQIILVQVVKEERGNKGAALTTYLSLAGRYCVLMPNSTHSGGISRKISSSSDRRRLKSMIGDLKVPSDMGLIVRTAGVSRTKAEITRDYDYLLRLWNDIRELTMKSVAPCLIYEEADLIRRAIRDMYTREIDEILVEGEAGFNTAKDSMKLLMPSHAKKVQHYRNRIPLYHRYQVEQQLESMYQPVCTLPSGGYIVINPTEALISIDVNSGKSTKEHNIEETALKTNLEATDEVARQLRLRDMAGLVVIDYIDMEDHRNNRAVERRMKDALKSDRARVQVEKISGFGLMEMSRQRLRPNLLEASTVECPHCNGAGIVRSVEAAALVALRKLEEEAIRSKSHILELTANSDVAGYLLNFKRRELSKLEERYTVRISITAELGLLGPTDFTLTRTAAPIEEQNEAVVTQESSALESETSPDESAKSGTDDDDDEGTRGRRRRRRGGRGRGRNSAEADSPENTDEQEETSEASEDGEQTERAEGDDEDDTRDGRGRRRGRRGGRRRRRSREDEAETAENPEGAEGSGAETEEAALVAEDQPAPLEAEAVEEKPRRRRRRKKPEAAAEPAGDSAQADDVAEKAGEAEAQPAEEAPAKPKRRRRKKPETADAVADEVPTADTAAQTDVTPPAEDTQADTQASVEAAPEAKTTATADDEAAAETDTAAQPTETPTDPEPQVKAPEPTIVPATPKGTSGKKGWWQRALKRD